jgi:hypothetical protein
MVGNGEAFKSKRLQQIRGDFPRLLFGIGDKETDVKAYLDNDLKAIWIPRVKDKPKDMRKCARKVRRWRDPNIIVVRDWSEIEQAVLGNFRRSTGQFAEMLDDRARTLEDRKRRRERRRRDDDDDEEEEEDDD